MGITGLLPFLEKSSKKTNINEFAGKTVAIDTYCWLHKGAFSCAEKLSMGEPTDAYVRYCMKFVHMLLRNKIKPILVFDGRHLPAKAQTEVKRRESRQNNRKKAAELMRMGQIAEARNLIRRSVDISHEMALEVIKECQRINIDCIVAPYEADAQLAYLNISGIADVVITEDSDLTLFGCKKVFFKMDIYGHGLLVDQEKLHLAMGMRLEHFDMDKFRYMCILSGCDYLPSLPGIGLTKAKKFITRNTDCDIYRALTRLGSYLNMKSVVVSEEYRNAFILAVITFKYQLVFCPLQRKQVRLNPPPADITAEQLHYAGKEMCSDVALQLAYGNCDPFTLKILHNFDPDKSQNCKENKNAWSSKTVMQHASIWSKDYKLQPIGEQIALEKPSSTWPDTVGQQLIMPTSRLKRTVPPKKSNNLEFEGLQQREILDTYKSHNSFTDGDKTDNGDKTVGSENDNSLYDERSTSPILIRRTNVFSKSINENKISPSLLSRGRNRLKARNIMRAKRTIIDENIITESKFFSKSHNSENSNILTDIDTVSLSNAPCKFSLARQNEKTECIDDRNGALMEIIMEKDDEEVLNRFSSEEKDERRNMQSENNVDKMPFMKSIETDRSSHNMDIDEELQDVSFLSNNSDESCKVIEESKTMTRCSGNFNDSSNCDSGKSQACCVMVETKSDILTTDGDLESDELVQADLINSLHSNLFKWSDRKSQETSVNKITKCSNRISLNSPCMAEKKITGNGQRRTKLLSTGQRQQSLLSMYGFNKKVNLKH
ncbi:hypothetical protein KM043_008970 [Ampulex compressa]|nr:hypothetical protein KM043_008970 [Ampulex compressa]